MKIFHTQAWFGWAIIVCLAVLFVRAHALAQEKKSVRVVFTSLAWNSELAFRVALARGLFKAQGIEIQPIFVRGGPAAMAALLSGEVDFAEIGGAQAVMRTRARGADVTIIGLISNTVKLSAARQQNHAGAGGIDRKSSRCHRRGGILRFRHENFPETTRNRSG